MLPEYTSAALASLVNGREWGGVVTVLIGIALLIGALVRRLRVTLARKRRAARSEVSD